MTQCGGCKGPVGIDGLGIRSITELGNPPVVMPIKVMTCRKCLDETDTQYKKHKSETGACP
jgi:hypothetical protein